MTIITDSDGKQRPVSDPTLSVLMGSPVGTLSISASNAGITRVHILDATEMDAAIDAGRNTKVQPISFQDNTIVKFVLACQQELEAYFSGQLQKFTVPLAQKGTVFQCRVWEQLKMIPYGNTVSYTTIAKRLGDPKIIRAAASANGRNNIAIIVPCHRVIGSSGELVGYAGGLHRKRWLLEHEQKFSRGLQTLF